MTRVLTDKLSYLEKSEASTDILETPSRKNFAEMFWCKNVRYQTDSKSDGFTWRMKNRIGLDIAKLHLKLRRFTGQTGRTQTETEC